MRLPTRAEIMAEKRAITRARLREKEALAEREKLEATRHAELLAAIKAAHPTPKKKRPTRPNPARKGPPRTHTDASKRPHLD